MRLPVYNESGERTQEILEFDEKIFGDQVRDIVLKEAILMHEARQRLGTHSTKTRKDCSGTIRKLWRQKGTGRARVGAARAPHWRGGGIVFGPHPRSYAYSMPKKAKRVAMNSAWLAKIQAKNVMIVENFGLGDVPKTKTVVSIFSSMGIINQKVLVAVPEKSDVLQKSLRNIPRVSFEDISRFNPYVLIYNEKIVMRRDTFESLIKEKGGTINSLKRKELYS